MLLIKNITTNSYLEYPNRNVSKLYFNGYWYSKTPAKYFEYNTICNSLDLNLTSVNYKEINKFILSRCEYAIIHKDKAYIIKDIKTRKVRGTIGRGKGLFDIDISLEGKDISDIKKEDVVKILRDYNVTKILHNE